MTETKKDDLPSIEVVLDEVRRKLDFQTSQLDALDTKSGILLGVDGVLMTILITYVITQPSLPQLALVKIILAPIFISLVLSFIEIAGITWHYPPQLDRLRDYYIVQDVNETKLRIIDIVMEAIKKNEVPIQQKLRLWKYSYIILAFGLGLIAVWAMTIII